MFGVKLDLKHYEDAVKAYESKPIETGRILFYGHSQFTRCQPDNKWGNPNIEEHILMKDGSPAVLNHGLGGSSADDLLYYYHRMVTPYKPRVLVLTIGGNDFPKGYSTNDVMEIFARVMDYARADFPDIPIYCVGCSYGARYKDPSTKAMVRRRMEFDKYLELYCKEKGYTYVDLRSQPFYYETEADVGNLEKIRDDIFCEDGGHLNEVGYPLFFDLFRKVLDKHL